VPFYRFEQFEDIVSNPHLSTGRGPIIEGDFMNLRLNNKDAGTGSKLHYHPNELMVFPLFGKIDSVVGKDHRIVAPGTFVHVAPNVVHSMKATMDGTLSYLYVKDRTWSMVGVAADEAPPERALSIGELKQKLARGETPGGDAASKPSEGIPDAPGDSYYPIVESLDTALPSAKRSFWVEGARLAFGFLERPAGHEDGPAPSKHEQFIYVIGGRLAALIGSERKTVSAGDILHVPKDAETSLVVGDAPARYVVFRPTARLEQMLEMAGGIARAG
jgi:quercetin dioxygenase-like cupin family protein